jgi:hypothetical protein
MCVSIELKTSRRFSQIICYIIVKVYALMQILAAANLMYTPVCGENEIVMAVSFLK